MAVGEWECRGWGEGGVGVGVVVGGVYTSNPSTNSL
jgi:hypothetical protein